MAVNVSVLRRGIAVVHLPTGRHGVVQGPDQRYFPDPDEVFVHFPWHGDRLRMIPVDELDIVQDGPGEPAAATPAQATVDLAGDASPEPSRDQPADPLDSIELDSIDVPALLTAAYQAGGGHDG